jgi:hypothetical protein
MVCSSGSIPVAYERYDIVQGSPFAFMVQLTGSSIMLNPYYVPQRTSETADSYNRTYWRIEIPTGVGGVCNGKLLFSATDRMS